MTFSAPSSGASAYFLGAGLTTTATTDSSGVATSPVVFANEVVGSYQVTGSVAGVAAPAVFTLTNTALPAIPSVTGLGLGVLGFLLAAAALIAIRSRDLPLS